MSEDRGADYWAAQIEKDRDGFRSWIASLANENASLRTRNKELEASEAALRKRVDELSELIRCDKYDGSALAQMYLAQCENERNSPVYRTLEIRAESAEKERDGYKRGLKDEARRFGEQVDRNEALEKRLAEAEQDRGY